MIQVKVHKTCNSIDERELLFKIRETIRELNNMFKNINVEELVPCNCSSDCDFQFPYNVLCNALENRIKEIQCHRSFINVNILNLLEGIDMLNKEEENRYAIKIENNPVITTTISATNKTSQTNTLVFEEIRNSVMEMQGDVAELQDELTSSCREDTSNIQAQLDNIKKDLSVIEEMNSTDEVKRSGKLNKIKRFLLNFSDENSNERKMLAGAKNIGLIVGGLLAKYNSLAEKIGMSQLPF